MAARQPSTAPPSHRPPDRGRRAPFAAVRRRKPGTPAPDRHQHPAPLATLALPPLRLLLPLPAFPAALDLHDTRSSPFAARRAVRGLVLAPWDCLGAVEGKVLQYCWGMGSLEGKGKGKWRERGEERSWTLGFVGVGEAAWWLLRHGQHGEGEMLREGRMGEVWVRLTEGNVLAVLQALAQGQGRLVLRVFWLQRGRGVEETRRRMEVREEEGKRGCEAMTAAGSPVSALGTLPGSPVGSAGSAGSVDGGREGWMLGEPAVCARCL